MLDRAVEHRVRTQVGVALRVPLIWLELRRYQGQAVALARLDGLEQTHRVAPVLDWGGEEVVQNQEVRPREAVERFVDSAGGPCHVQSSLDMSLSLVQQAGGAASCAQAPPALARCSSSRRRSPI